MLRPMTSARIRKRKRLLIALTTLGVLMALLAAVLFYGSRAAPAWWYRAGRLPADASERAAAMERGAVSLIHAARPDEPAWSVALEEADANAWLEHRLAGWLANRGSGPPGFVPRVAFDDGRLRIGLGMERKRVMWMVFGVVFMAPAQDDPAGMPEVWLSLEQAGVGRIPVPSVFVKQVALPVMDRAMAGWLASDDEERLRLRLPTLELSDGRRVRVLGVSVEAGRVTFDLITDR